MAVVDASGVQVAIEPAEVDLFESLELLEGSRSAVSKLDGYRISSSPHEELAVQEGQSGHRIAADGLAPLSGPGQILPYVRSPVFLNRLEFAWLAAFAHPDPSTPRRCASMI